MCKDKTTRACHAANYCISGWCRYLNFSFPPRRDGTYHEQHGPTMSVREVASAEFYQLSRRTEGKLLVVQFTATWCGPCRRVAPQYEALARRTLDVEFVKVRACVLSMLLSRFSMVTLSESGLEYRDAVTWCYNVACTIAHDSPHRNTSS